MHLSDVDKLRILSNAFTLTVGNAMSVPSDENKVRQALPALWKSAGRRQSS